MTVWSPVRLSFASSLWKRDIDWLIDWLIYVRVSTITAIWTVGHRLRSTPTNGHRFTALSIPWQSPIQVPTGLDVTTSVTESPSKHCSLPRTSKERLKDNKHNKDNNVLLSFNLSFEVLKKWCDEQCDVDQTADNNAIMYTSRSWTTNQSVSTIPAI